MHTAREEDQVDQKLGETVMPSFPDLYGEVRQEGHAFIYSEARIDHDPDKEEAHDVVEPRFFEARKVISEAGFKVDYENSGCDHDSFWVVFI